MSEQTDLPRPTPKQLAWQDLEFGMFCHFGPNTFLDQEWGTGEEDPQVFNPAALDPGQWVRAAREVGMRYLVFTAKHHDGFCLWPTDTTDHNVKSSPLPADRRDVVELVAAACQAEGIKLGLYCSPWDRHEPSYNDCAAYDEFYCCQWHELLSRYGPLVCVWLDGAGSQGHVYNWERIIGTIREAQPETAIFNMGAPDYRWVGNEDGLATDPCWNVVERRDFDHEHLLPEFRDSFPHWLPAECDARIRANWFWHESDTPSLKSVERLVDMYYCSVGRGCNLLLNVGPDNRGLLPETDVDRLLETAAELRRRFGRPLGEARGPAVGLEVRFDQPTLVNHTVCCEDIAAGERVRSYMVQVLTRGRWEGLAVGTAMGHKKIDRFATVLADAVRVHVARADGEPRFKSLQVFCY
ncbi:MAG: alpha-L-fucosidase [Armatimonadota bacterium]